MVKWYFVASGIAGNVILKETKAYPERLRCALEYIAQRVGGAAYSPQSSVPALVEDSPTPGDGNSDGNGDGEQFICLADPSPLTSTTQVPPSTSTSQNPPSTSTPPPPRGTKRTAEDVSFEDLALILQKDHALTKNINDVDAELNLLGIQRENFLVGWEKQRQEAMGRRNKIEKERGEVSRRFKKMSLAVAMVGSNL
jgi:hypothetical protein